MTNNIVNGNKTELFVFTPHRQVDTFKGLNKNIGNTSVDMGSKIWNLGVTLDQTMSMLLHVNYPQVPVIIR